MQSPEVRSIEMKSNTNRAVCTAQIEVAKRLLHLAQTGRTFRHHATVETTMKLSDLIVNVGLHGWEHVFEWEDGQARLQEAAKFGLIWLTTVEMLDLATHIPLWVEYRPTIWQKGTPCWHHVATGDENVHHESWGGIEEVTLANFMAAYPDEGQPVWKVIAAPEVPTLPVCPSHPRVPGPCVATALSTVF
jgi:hypothetical protein